MPGKQKQRKTKSKRNQNETQQQSKAAQASRHTGLGHRRVASRRFGSLGLAIVLGHVALKANYGGSSRKNK